MMKKCIRCHRPITDLESIKRGMGETCAIRSGLIMRKQKITLKINTVNILYKPNFLFELGEQNDREVKV